MMNRSAEVLPLGVSELMVSTHKAGAVQTRADCVAQEVPVAMVFNGISHAVMMASPADLHDFALGFGLLGQKIDECGQIAVDPHRGHVL